MSREVQIQAPRGRLHTARRQGRIRHQGYVAGPFDGRGHHALVSGAITGNPAGNDFAAFSDKITQNLDILVIYEFSMFGAKPADFAAVIGLSFSIIATQVHISSPDIT
jgi:hypothetical protein